MEDSLLGFVKSTINHSISEESSSHTCKNQEPNITNLPTWNKITENKPVYIVRCVIVRVELELLPLNGAVRAAYIDMFMTSLRRRAMAVIHFVAAETYATIAYAALM